MDIEKKIGENRRAEANLILRLVSRFLNRIAAASKKEGICNS